MTDGGGPGAGDASERRVTSGELFFDLVFVIAVTRTSALLEHDHSWLGLLSTLVVFVPVYWLWVGAAIQTNLTDGARPAVRLRIFTVALAAVFMAIALPDAYGALGPVFAFAYWAGRIVLGVGVVRRAVASGRVPLNPYGISMVVTGPMLVVGSFLPAMPRLILWGVAAVLDLSTPTLLSRQLRDMHYDASHLTERFSLFVLIALGESLVSVATSAVLEHFGVVQGFAVAVAFVFASGLWWVYFHFAADAMRHSLATAQVQLHITRLVLSYGHLAFVGAVIAVAVGLRESIAEPTEPISWSIAGVLIGGTALYLATFGFTRWAMFRLISSTRLVAAGIVLITLAVVTVVPALVELVLLAVILVGVNVVEYARVNHPRSWPAIGARRPDGSI